MARLPAFHIGRRCTISLYTLTIPTGMFMLTGIMPMPFLHGVTRGTTHTASTGAARGAVVSILALARIGDIRTAVITVGTTRSTVLIITGDLDGHTITTHITTTGITPIIITIITVMTITSGVFTKGFVRPWGPATRDIPTRRLQEVAIL
jgi:hypothetical protein